MLNDSFYFVCRVRGSDPPYYRGFLVHKYFLSNSLVEVSFPPKLEIEFNRESWGHFTEV